MSNKKNRIGDKRRQQTRERMLAAAQVLFLKQGFSGTSLEQVAEVAGVTKPTVYSHFGSKQGLLLAIAQAHATALVARFSLALEPSGDCPADLARFAEVFSRGVLSEEAVRWRRLAIMESLQHPELGESLYASGPARVMRALTDFLHNQSAAGNLQCPQPDLAAEQFIGLLVGLHPIHTLMGQPLPSEEDRRRRCQSAVSVFMAAYGRTQ